MIRTFEELFEKMKVAGHDPQSLMAMHEQYQHWKMESEKDTMRVDLSAFVHLQMYRDNLLGYLSCLQDTAYVSQSEYDQLWNLLNLPDVSKKGKTMDDSLEDAIDDCIADLEKFQWSGYDGAAYAAGYLHEYPKLRRLLTIIAGMKKE